MNQSDSLTPYKICIETWGCQMNIADSESILSIMKNHDYLYTSDADDADLILLNTCHIREKAKHKVISRLGRLKILKDKNPDITIAVAGCVAQAEGKKLLDQAPTIDILLGPGKIKDLPTLVTNFKKEKTRQISLGFSNDKNKESNLISTKVAEVPQALSGKSEITRFVNIQQGCNNFCTFCVVPFTRGKEVSDTKKNIIKQVTEHTVNGVSEITLLGQNVNSYGLDLIENGLVTKTEESPFVDLLRSVSNIEALKRLRFTTSNPHDFTYDLAKLFYEQPKLGRHLHLPVQSGSNKILNRMKRKVTIEEYWERIGWLRKFVPDIAISTDIIVGFPGETQEDFECTYELIRDMRFCFIYSFKYSVRKKTAAARFGDKVSDDIQTKRLARLNQLQDKITLELAEEEIGKEREVLFHYESEKDPGVYYGKSEHFRLVRVKSKQNLIGKMINVKIEGGNKTAMVGSLL